MEGEKIIEPIIVGGFTVRVEDASSALQYQQLCGSWLGYRNLIQISTTYDKQTQAQTLVHETLHAINAVYLESREVDEATVAAMAQGWFQVIIDNPHLIKKIWSMAEAEREGNGVKDTEGVGEKD